MLDCIDYYIQLYDHGLNVVETTSTFTSMLTEIELGYTKNLTKEVEAPREAKKYSDVPTIKIFF